MPRRRGITPLLNAYCFSSVNIYEITGQYGKAVSYWEEVIRVLHEEWKITEGEAVDRPGREIIRLQEVHKASSF